MSKRPIRKVSYHRVFELFSDGFSLEELSIMYNTSVLQVERVLEQIDIDVA